MLTRYMPAALAFFASLLVTGVAAFVMVIAEHVGGHPLLAYVFWHWKQAVVDARAYETR